MEAVLASAYFAPIQWFHKLVHYDRVWIECFDNYQKQTYRNRCIIATTAGRQALTVPVENFETLKCAMKDVRISNHGSWRHQHWNALSSAYGESPFFEFYEDDIRPFFDEEWEFLFDYNMAITRKICELIDIEPNIKITDEYYTLSPLEGESSNDEMDDFRDIIRPKHPGVDNAFTARRYYQVYEQKNGFQENLSILDLLFNMGPESAAWLR